MKKNYGKTLLENALDLLQLGKEFNDINSKTHISLGQDFITTLNTNRKDLSRFNVKTYDNNLPMLNQKLNEYIEQHPDSKFEILGLYLTLVSWIKLKNIRPITLLIHTLCDALIEKFLKHSCKKGCSYCCHQRVTIFYDEWLLIKEHTNLSQFDFSEYANLTEADLNDRKIKCPFLVNDLCEIYIYRPFACRQHINISPVSDCISGKQVQLAYIPSLIAFFSAISEVYDDLIHMDVNFVTQNQINKA